MTEEFFEIVTQIKLAVAACGRRIEELERKVSEERFRADANYVQLCKCKAQDEEIAALKKEVSDLQFILRSKNAEIENLRRVYRSIL